MPIHIQFTHGWYELDIHDVTCDTLQLEQYLSDMHSSSSSESSIEILGNMID
jgi:hypothetical protein